MSAQVSVVCRTGYYQLWQLRPLLRRLHDDAAKTLIQAFINTRLDYYNSLYYGIADGLMSLMQSVQNAAARLITGVRRCEHITPVLRQLHWLPVRRRVGFKPSTLVYRSLAGTAPQRWWVYTGQCRWPPSIAVCWQSTCIVNRSRKQFGDRCFATATPMLWNSLPEQLRQPDITFGQFKRSLKTFMFG